MKCTQKKSLWFVSVINFSPAAGGEGDITWLKGGDEVDDEEIVQKVDETSSKLVIKKASLEDAGRYTCKCDYDNGHQDDTQVSLYVYGKTRLKISELCRGSCTLKQFWYQYILLNNCMNRKDLYFVHHQRAHHLVAPPPTMSFWKVQMGMYHAW